MQHKINTVDPCLQAEDPARDNVLQGKVMVYSDTGN